MRKRITWSMVLFLSILLPACRSQGETIEAPAKAAHTVEAEEATPAAPGTLAAGRYPGETWMQYADPQEAGWSSQKLAEAQAYAESIGSAAVMLVQGGTVAAAWGDTGRRFMAHSIRKSFLSALYGIHVEEGEIDLDQTLGDLGIDDLNGLSDLEKQARVVDLLTSSSGVYHRAAYESSARKDQRPARGSHAPGEFWYYNNWDFNALATIYRQGTGGDIFLDFQSQIAEPLQMQDYRPRDGYYRYERELSSHPAYLFRVSARDLARFGWLYLNGGSWEGKQLVPRAWVAESTGAQIQTSTGEGYGYLWWTAEGALKKCGAYYASGAGAQRLVILPALDLVFVHLANTYRRNEDNEDQINHLLVLLLSAKEGEPGQETARRPMPEPALMEPTLELPEGALNAYTGTYQYPTGEAIEVRLENGELMMNFGYGWFGLLPLAEDEFLVEDTRERVRFTQGQDGEPALIYEAYDENPMSAPGEEGAAVPMGER